MITSKPVPVATNTNEAPGPLYRPGPSLHVKFDGHRVVERRSTELRRLHRQFNEVVARPARFQDESVQSWLNTGYVPVKQRWCPRLERDIEAVCGEAGLSRAATESVLRSASSGTIPANPGVLLSRLLRFQDCLAEPLGRRGVLAVLRCAPSLLRYSPESLRWNADMLASLLPDGTLPSVVTRVPFLLPASAMTLWGNLEGLRSLLRLDHDAALRLVVRAPRLLLNTRGALLGRLQDLVRLSDEPPRVVASLVTRQPALLGYFPGTLERKLRHVASLLGVPFARVQRLLVKQPSLAMLSRATAAARIAQLRVSLDLVDRPADLASVVLRQPALVTLSPDSIACKVAVVARVLGLEGRPEELRAVVCGAPQLLTLSAASIETKAAALRAAAAPCGALRAQLESAPPLSVAVWLCLSSKRYEHVRAVAEAVAAAEAEAEAAGGACSATAVTPGGGAVCGSESGGVSRSGSGSAHGVAVEAAAGCDGSEPLAGTVCALLPPPVQLPCASGGDAGGGGGGTHQEPQGPHVMQQASPEAAPPRRGRGRPRKQQQEQPPSPQCGDQEAEAAQHGEAVGRQAGTEARAGQRATGGGRRPRLSLYALLKEAPGAAGGATVAAEATGAAAVAAERRGAATAATRTRRRAAARVRAQSE